LAKNGNLTGKEKKPAKTEETYESPSNKNVISARHNQRQKRQEREKFTPKVLNMLKMLSFCHLFFISLQKVFSVTHFKNNR